MDILNSVNNTIKEKIMEKNKIEEIEKICHNCNSHFPTSRVFAETAICLNNPAFEPYIDELIENYNYACCQELIDKYQFPNEQEACPDFDPIEMSDIEDISEEKKIEILNKINLESFFDSMKSDDYPIEKFVGKLNSEDKKERENALSHLGVAIGQKNKNSSKAVCDYYCNLPPATTLEDVYWRIDILKKIK